MNRILLLGLLMAGCGTPSEAEVCETHDQALCDCDLATKDECATLLGECSEESDAKEADADYAECFAAEMENGCDYSASVDTCCAESPDAALCGG